MKVSRLSSLLIILLLAVMSVDAPAQSVTSGLSGTVMDEQQAVIPGATVTVRNQETNATRSTVTDSEGRFRLSNLPVGTYEMIVEQKDFARYIRSPITLTLNQQASADVVLQPVATQEVVTVSADVELINKSNAEVGVRFDQRRISELPLSPNRNVLNLVLSAPGVSQLSSGNSGFAAGGVTFSVNGMRTRSNNFMIDGQDSNDPSITGLQQPLNNPDLIQEVRLITNQFLPEFGRAAGSVVNIVTKSGTNEFHGSAFFFHNDNNFNARSNLDKALVKGKAKFSEAPFRVENQFGGTFGGPIIKDRTFFFGSVQGWTDRQLGSGSTINGVPTEEGRQILQQMAGGRPQVAALLRFLPAAQSPIGKTAALKVGGQTFQIPLGSLSGASSIKFDNSQFSVRIDHRFNDKHTLGGRYLWNDQETSGNGQATPPGLTTVVPSRQQAATVNFTSILTPKLFNELRFSYQRFGSITTAADPSSQEIPSIEIAELGLTGFNAAASRTAIGLAVNLPQFRFNNTYQIQETLSYTLSSHALKAGIDFRRTDVKSFFFPTIRGLLRYPTLQQYVDDVAEAANINKPLPGGQEIQYYRLYDYFAFFQDEWRIHPTLTLTYGLRYETPGEAISNLRASNERIIATAGGDQRFALTPIPKRDTNNFQPRFGFSWNPRTSEHGILGLLTGGNKLVLRGGYSRTHDFAFINIALNVASSFPLVAAINRSNLSNAFNVLPTLVPSGLNPLTLTRTVVADDFRSPYADQYSLQIQRELSTNFVLSVGYVGTKGTGLFQTIDGNPRLPNSTVRSIPERGVIRLRANAASSIYHSMQISLDRRLAKGFSAGAHYTWSSYIDDASEIFNPSVSGEVAISQNSFNRRADRARSTYDRPHRFSANFVYELPYFAKQQGLVGHLLGGWQINSFVTLQSGAPFTVLNGSDPSGALAGIDGLVGNAIRASLNTDLNVSSMSVQEILKAGGAKLFRSVSAAERIGNLGRNALRADGIANLDFGIFKNTNISESQRLQIRIEMYNATNTRNYGIPEARLNSANFLNEGGTDGGNRRIVLSLRYIF
ncbi:MAG: carboxypeptidase regulatory-like domain-containing protein [Acidobacteriota bacterium]